MSDCFIGTDKCLVKACSDLFTGWVECTDLEQLKSYGDLTTNVVEGLHWKPECKIPAALMKKVLGTIQHYPKTETGYVIYRNGRINEWDIRAPEQLGNPAHVNFFEEEHPDQAFQVVGTIHTHPEMSAFWSGTDLNDQTKKPGTLHMVFGLRNGHVDKTLCTVFLKNVHYDIPIEEIVEAVDFTENLEPVPEWVEIIDKQSYKVREKLTSITAFNTNYPKSFGYDDFYFDTDWYAGLGGSGKYARGKDKAFPKGMDLNYKDIDIATKPDKKDSAAYKLAEATLENLLPIIEDISFTIGPDEVLNQLSELWDDADCAYPICQFAIEEDPIGVLCDVLEHLSTTHTLGDYEKEADVLSAYKDELEALARLAGENCD